jgi:hypothetical protein
MKLKTTPVPNVVLDIHLKDLKLAEIKVLLIVIRQTLGWKDTSTLSERKEIDWLSTNFLATKTGCSKRAINDAISVLSNKKLIETYSRNNELLDTPEKRRGHQKLFFSLGCASFAVVENIGINCVEACKTDSANAEIADDLRKNSQELAQKMLITKEIPLNQFL